MLICPSCGRESPPDAAFCARCGTSLEALRPPGLEERKVVTVLFADLVGSRPAESHDPEEVRSILTAYYARLRVELERHGGTVEKFIGDAVMARLRCSSRARGRPRARCPGGARDSRGAPTRRPAVDVRIAVHTGEALVALGARPPTGEGMVAGDVVNTAARLQAAAPVERDPRRRDDLPRDRACDRVPASRRGHAKGKAEPVPVWEAVEREARIGVDVERAARAARRARARGRRARAARCARAARAGAAARDARRRARDRQEPARRRAVRGRRRATRADHMAAGPLACHTARASASGRSARW